jgi:hypothetical protein
LVTTWVKAPSVAQVQENQAAVVAPRIHPAGQRHRLADVVGTKLAAIVGLVHSGLLKNRRQSAGHKKTARLVGTGG